MTPWSPKFLTLLTLAMGAMTPGIILSPVLAGEKIDFSAPTAAVAVPKADPTISTLPDLTAPAPQVQIPDGNLEPEAAPSTVMIVAPVEHHLLFDTPSDEDHDNKSLSAYSEEPLDLGMRGGTNRLNAASRWLDDSREREFSGRDVSAGRDVRFQGKAENDANFDRSDPLARDYFKHRKNSAFADHGSTEDDGSGFGSARQKFSTWTHSFGFLPSDHPADDTAINNFGTYSQPNAVNITTAPSDTALRDGTSGLGADPYSRGVDDLRRRDENNMTSGATPRYRSKNESAQQTAGYDSYEPVDPAAIPSQVVREQPAVLPFPKRPGDLLK